MAGTTDIVLFSCVCLVTFVCSDVIMRFLIFSYLFHYICHERIVYLCITDDVSICHVSMWVSLWLHSHTELSVSLAGVWALPCIWLPEWGEKEISDHLWLTSTDCAALRHEQWVFQHVGCTNGTCICRIWTCICKHNCLFIHHFYVCLCGKTQNEVCAKVIWSPRLQSSFLWKAPEPPSSISQNHPTYTVVNR